MTWKDISALTRFPALCVSALLMQGIGAEAAQPRVAVTATGYEVFEPVISIAWVDNNQLLFKGSRSGTDPKRPSLEPSSIYLWNDTTKIARVYAKGRNFCYAQGNVSILLRSDNQARKAVYLEGMLGAEKEIEKQFRSNTEVFNKFSCRLQKLEEFVPPLPKTHFYLVLREGDGYLTLRPHGSKEERAHPRNITLYPEKGAKPVTLPITWDESVGGVGTTYSELLGVYVLPPRQLIPGRGPGNWPSDEPRIVYLLHRDGRVERISFPATSTFSRPSPVKSGWIYGGGDFYRTSGLYIYSDNAVRKLDAGNVNYLAVSPNGCKAAVAINNRHLDMGMPVNLKIFNFCLEGN